MMEMKEILEYGKSGIREIGNCGNWELWKLKIVETKYRGYCKCGICGNEIFQKLRIVEIGKFGKWGIVEIGNCGN